MWFDLIHFCFALYSIIAQPIRVAFDLPLNTFFAIMEGLCLIENIIFIIVQFRVAVDLFGVWTLQPNIVLAKFLENGLISEIIATIPFNFILNGVDSHSIPLTLLRIHRVILITRINALLNSTEIRNQNLGRVFIFGKVSIYLFALWNLASCFWMYYLTFVRTIINLLIFLAC